MYRVDLAAVAAAAAHIAGLGEDMATAHVLSDNRIAAAQAGWVGTSAAALDAAATEWSQTSRRLLTRLGDHASELADDGIALAAAETGSAGQLGSV